MGLESFRVAFAHPVASSILFLSVLSLIPFFVLVQVLHIFCVLYYFSQDE